MSANKEKDGSRRLKPFQCEITACKGKPATKLIECWHADGDRERRMMCDKHADEEHRFWSAQDWDTGVKVSDIEEWALAVSSNGRTFTRVGNKCPRWRAEALGDALGELHQRSLSKLEGDGKYEPDSQYVKTRLHLLNKTVAEREDD